MSKNIESHLSEDRVFQPSKEFSKKARIKSMAQYKRMYRESIDKPGVFWAREAKELVWQKNGPRLSIGSPLMRSGLWEENLMSAKAALTNTSRTAVPTKPLLFGRENQAKTEL
jgi:hypothetical protein